MISDAEMAVQLRITRQFIDADATEIEITPRIARESDGAGGWRNIPGSPLAPISVRLVPQSDAVPESASPEGTRPLPEMVLVAMPGVDIQRYDTFEWSDKVWKITHVHDKPPYAFKADVVVRG